MLAPSFCSYIMLLNVKVLFWKVSRISFFRNSAIKGHLDNCLNVQHWFSINNFILNDVNTHEFRLNLVRQNTRIIDESNNWNVLLFKEAYHIKEKCPILNNDAKGSREMQLFWLQFNYNTYTNHVLIVSFCSNMFLDYILLFIHKDIFACLFSIHNIISLSCHEQVSLSGLRISHIFALPFGWWLNIFLFFVVWGLKGCCFGFNPKSISYGQCLTS